MEMFEKKQIRYYKWEPLDDNLLELKNITNNMVYDKDIEVYIELVIKKTARNLKLDYEYANKIIREENKPFFDAKKALFSKRLCFCISTNSDYLLLFRLFKLFYIPLNVEEDIEEVDRVNKIIQLYNSLTNIERLKFLSKIEKVSIKVDKI